MINQDLESHSQCESDTNQEQVTLTKNSKWLAIGLFTVGILVLLATSTHSSSNVLGRIYNSITAQGCGHVCSLFPSYDRKYCIQECTKLPRHANRCAACMTMCPKHGGQPKPCRNSCKPVCSHSQVREYAQTKAKQDVIGGTQASNGEFPTIVALFVKINGANTFFCAGTVSSTQDVLTAGHCCDAVTSNGFTVADMTVVAGEWNQGVNHGTEQTRSVTKMTIHPDYITETSSAGTRADLCVLNLNAALTMNDYVMFLLPSAPSASGNEACTMAGWGSTTNQNGAAVSTLQKATMTTITDATCQTKMGKTVYSDNVCAYHPSAGACVGDSGGPLIRNSDGRVIGVVSWGDDNCRVGASYPTAYAEVNTYYTWVNQTGVGETCVSQESVVRMKRNDGDVELARLSDVKEGDLIETVHGFEAVYFVVRPKVAGRVAMVKMVMEKKCGNGDRVTISLTKEHMLFDGMGQLTRADEFGIGDSVSLHGCNGRIVDVSESMEEPMSVVTDSGEFVLANGVRVSTYSHSPVFAKVVHALTMPLRVASRIFGKNVGSWIGQALRLDRVFRPSFLKNLFVVVESSGNI